MTLRYPFMALPSDPLKSHQFFNGGLFRSRIIVETTQLSWIVSYIWGIADDVLRDLYNRGKYRDVILPMTVLRRFDAVLEDVFIGYGDDVHKPDWIPHPGLDLAARRVRVAQAGRPR